MLPCFVTESLLEIGDQLGLLANGAVSHGAFLFPHATIAFVNPIDSVWARQWGPGSLKRELECQGGIKVFKVNPFFSFHLCLDITVKAT